MCKQKVPNSVSPIPFLEFPFSQETAASGKEETKMSFAVYNPPCPESFQL